MHSGVTRLSLLFRQTVVFMTALSWLVISNHCALASVMEGAQPKKVSACPMHAKPSGPDQKPARGAQVCCRTLSAAKAKMFQQRIIPPALPLLAVLPSNLFDTPSVAGNPIIFSLDTGPPGYLSFSELVLQRSLLSHAPPVLV
jgi:hypothetical protein